MKFLHRYHLNRTLDTYVEKLGPSLKRRYGVAEQYTVPQICKTLRALKLNEQYIVYAIALFRHEESKNTIGLYNIDQAALDQLRQTVSVRYFGGNLLFSVGDVLSLSTPRRWRGGASPSWQANRFGRTSL